jgi:hypothetical protein
MKDQTPKDERDDGEWAACESTAVPNELRAWCALAEVGHDSITNAI